jgi:hypothetical protein
MSDKKTEVEFNEDVFESMLTGTFDPDTEVDASEKDAEEVDDTQEDTDQEEESEVEEETNEDLDGDTEDTSDAEEDDEEEDSLVEDYDSDDEADSDDEDESEEDEEDTDDVSEESEEEEESDVDSEESEDETETEGSSDGEAQDTDEVDYKAFYDSVVNTEFVVNGKKVKGFADPKKIIQSQQMAGGFSEKMAAFKQYRPFMAPLKERGMLDDPAKFDLAMNLIDGDVDAIKAHLKSLEVDPLDLDMEQVDYNVKPTTASPEAITVEDTLEVAKSMGIEDQVRQVIGNEWDAESFQEFVSNDAVRRDLLEHMATGVYDKVQDKMLELSRLDYNGAYGSLSTVNKYRAAVRELQREQPVQQQEVAVEKSTKPAVKKSGVKAEKAKIVKAREAEEYKTKAAEREASITKQRKKAASVSRKKAKAKPKAKFDPLEVEGEELDQLMDFLITSGRR